MSIFILGSRRSAVQEGRKEGMEVGKGGKGKEKQKRKNKSSCLYIHAVFDEYVRSI